MHHVNPAIICPFLLNFLFCIGVCRELIHLKRPWCWERLRAGGEGDDRRWDGWMASPTQWTWVWVNSGSWWWTGKPGAWCSMGSQGVGYDWATDLNWTVPNIMTLGVWEALGLLLSSASYWRILVRARNGIQAYLLFRLERAQECLTSNMVAFFIKNCAKIPKSILWHNY